MPAHNSPTSGELLPAEMGAQAAAAVITPAMLQEEEQLAVAGAEEERQMLAKARMSWDRDSSEMRYKRLQHLLEKSNIYSKFLLTKMEQQQLEVDKKCIPIVFELL
ncbi:PREDICTED: lymphoid-specific helicase-like [Crocodylus porosus]|uniref:lymphoid-specific helicase-like n=1 Tax=Crocodylus porosus TaxID=8502 RepID=UPI000938FDD9|nr:PREDICTED: lymphoid-specific helicase-like [Crocodylus porosus]